MIKLEYYSTNDIVSTLKYLDDKHPNCGYLNLDRFILFNTKLKDNMVKVTIEYEEPTKKVSISENEIDEFFETFKNKTQYHSFYDSLKKDLKAKFFNKE